MAERKDVPMIDRADLPDARPAEARPDARPAEDAGQREVQQRVDKENAQGFVGIEVDVTDNHAYTVAGVLAGEETPESHPDSETAAKARRAAGFR